MDYAKILSLELGIKEEYCVNLINLLDEGDTVPFISRYRKEMHGACDDQIIRQFDDRLKYLRNINKRKDEIIRLITEQEKMTPELAKAIDAANTLTEVEDIYRPFKPKRQTRASIAAAKGLTPLAERILSQKDKFGDINEIAAQFINEEKGVKSVEDALNGAKDIVSEMISDNAELRKKLRVFIYRTAEMITEAKKNALTDEKAKVYEMYFNYKEAVNKLPSHRILAINRGEKEDFLKVTIKVNEEKCIEIIRAEFFKNESIFTEIMESCYEDSFERLILPSLEREIRTSLTDDASEQAIKMFEINLKPLLMQPPLKDKIILGLDPGYRTGCKVAVINSSSAVLDTGVIYPTPPHSKIEESEKKITDLINKHKVDVISIGNGTATKETENFVAGLIKKLNRKVEYMVVNEAGASVYSASKLGAKEFPEFDVALRSAVSIARRLQDPLAELIKIDVKSIGVGQYQHDMPQARLTEVLTGVVEACVNTVGVDLNTASPSLLSFVSGLSDSIAKNIEDYRNENGEFKSREELLKVKKLGGKAYEQCAGFLRITDGKNILDNTSVHPESYPAAEKLLKLFNLNEASIKNGACEKLPKMVEEMGAKKVAAECGSDEHTVQDIALELAKPGRDIRDDLPKLELKSDILSLEDLEEGMILKGTVRNVIDFGAFVDIGVHQDGLVHISQICDRYIKHPSEELKVGQLVKVKILAVDKTKSRISLTMKNIEE